MPLDLAAVIALVALVAILVGDVAALRAEVAELKRWPIVPQSPPRLYDDDLREY